MSDQSKNYRQTFAFHSRQYPSHRPSNQFQLHDHLLFNRFSILYYDRPCQIHSTLMRI
jgi:hypothetical protein